MFTISNGVTDTTAGWPLVNAFILIPDGDAFEGFPARPELVTDSPVVGGVCSAAFAAEMMAAEAARDINSVFIILIFRGQFDAETCLLLHRASRIPDGFLTDSKICFTHSTIRYHHICQ
jgi:hypothetical protein